jgi:hypothetical protein
MSLPAQKAFSPAPVMTTARTSARALQSFTWATSASAISGVTALSFSGRLRIRVATRSRTSKRMWFMAEVD